MTTNIAIIDYGMGNLASVEKVFKKIGAAPLITNSEKDIDRACFIVLPGVGAFGDGMENLVRLGLISVLTRKVIKEKTPFLGICLGMQLLGEVGYEFGINRGLGWIKGEAVALKTKKHALPHMGWNNIVIRKNDPLFKEMPDNNFYFVHSFHLKCNDQSIVSSTCNYGQKFVSSIHSKNIFATQFHPEKSQLSGLKLLENFINHKPC